MNTLITALSEKYANKRVLVMGLGLQGGGVGVARFFAQLGAVVTATDTRSKEVLEPSIDALKDYPITYVLGEHRVEDFISSDLVFKGPSVPWHNTYIQKAIEHNIPVEMEVSFFASHFPGTIVGVTGTRGKSTTTTLIYEILKGAGRSAHIAGNIPGASTISLLRSSTKTDVAVLELSSFALSGFHKKKISPHVAVLTSLYPDHLNYYPSMEEYVYDKKAIYLYQSATDILIAHAGLKQVLKSDNPRGQCHFVDHTLLSGAHIELKGEHNADNAALAYQAATALGVAPETAHQVIATFSGLPHRQEILGEKDGITYVNDTTSTTPIATITAIHTHSDKPIVLILGGNAKQLPTSDLIQALANIKHIVLLKGSLTDEILPQLQQKYPEKLSAVFDSLEPAVSYATQKAHMLGSATYVLFSPGATSFAMYNNEFHRGAHFSEIVKKLFES